MIKPREKWHKFKSKEEKIEKLKELKIISPKAKKIKDLYYKGLYVSEITKCAVIGFVNNSEIVLNVKGQLHSIHPDYFKDMQKKTFSF